MSIVIWAVAYIIGNKLIHTMDLKMYGKKDSEKNLMEKHQTKMVSYDRSLSLNAICITWSRIMR